MAKKMHCQKNFGKGGKTKKGKIIHQSKAAVPKVER